MQILLFALVTVAVASAANVARRAGDVPVATTDVEFVIKVCKPGHTKMEDCASCFCVPDGSGYVCTRMGCWEGTCEPNTTYKFFCETCQCPSNGLRKDATCTRLNCSET